MSFENNMGKGENAGNQHFFLFSHNVFNPSKYKNIILATFMLLSANSFKLDQADILSFGEEVKV